MYEKSLYDISYIVYIVSYVRFIVRFCKSGLFRASYEQN